MSAPSMLRLANGKDISLRNPTAADYSDFAWQAEHLAKENRYNGATPGVIYSVAQHIAIGTGAILEATGDEELAAYFSLHDNPESALKDDTTPKKNAIAEIAQEKFGVLGTAVLASFNELTERHDAAVHEAAGLPWPISAELQAKIKFWDLTMFVTEWRDLMGNAPHPDWKKYKGIAPLTKTIVPYERWQEAANHVHVLWIRLLPTLKARRA